MKKEYIYPTTEVYEITEKTTICNTSNPEFNSNSKDTVDSGEELSREMPNSHRNIWDSTW